MQVVRFYVSGNCAAFPVAHVREVVPRSRLAAVFNAPPFLEGVMNVRGEAVPVFDLARLFGFQSQHPSGGSVLIAEAGLFTAGFLASPPVDIIDVDDGEQEARLPEGSPQLAALDRALSVDGKLVLLLSPDQLFDLPEMQSLREEEKLLTL